MSLRIALDDPPEFYTNLDLIRGRVVLGLSRSEQIGSIVVKLEGESVTGLQSPNGYVDDGTRARQPPGGLVSENHKILYKVQQVFPDDYYASTSNPYGAYPLQPGEHVFPFKFKLPINNACSDPMAMAQIGGVANAGGFGGSLFGIGGVRVMDGSKQLYLQHVTKTLPPSLTGYPMSAEIRYYLKVTIQRPGFLKENWRYQIGLKFLPMEPPRPAKTSQEAFARRPFTFKPNTPGLERKRTSFFSKNTNATPDSAAELVPPSIEMSARLPFPTILTCNKPIPLRLIAKKLIDSLEQVYLVSFQMELLGYTDVRAQTLRDRKVNRWIVASTNSICVPVTAPENEVGKEVVVPDEVWKTKPLPNTVAPSFLACNLSRKYEIEIKLGLSWGKPLAKGSKERPPQVLYLPLHFATLEVFSGITPPPELVEAARSNRPGRATFTNARPHLPPRPNQSTSGTRPQQQQQQVPVQQQQPPSDPLYPPQLGPGDVPHDDAPPSYDEAMAEHVPGPFDGTQPRPAYSGMTDENAPSHMPPEKS